MKDILSFLRTLTIIPIAIALLPAATKGFKMEDQARMPAVAGQFYNGDPAALRREIEEYFSSADNAGVDGRVYAIVAPHAGYLYSGRVAAEAFALIDGADFETVVVISPCHVDYFPFSSVFTGSSYVTPLGAIPVDGKLGSLIASSGELVRTGGRGHLYSEGARGEHSLEVQLPFLQVALGDFHLVPIVMGDQSYTAAKSLGQAIGKALEGRNALIVASTDLSHFHTDQVARELDSVFIEGLESLDPETLLGSIADQRTEACGGGPAAAAMIAAKHLGASSCRIMKYATSGEVSGDRKSVVGYVSAIFTDATKEEEEPDGSGGRSSREKDDEDINNRPGEPDGLSREEKLFLLRYAREVLEASFRGDEPGIDIPAAPVLAENRGGFVTLKKHGHLRGCIGYIEAFKPLVETVHDMAENAAFNDPRFPGLEEGELDDVTIEISVLSPIRKIDDPKEVVVGKHGIIISRGGYRGLLLPQVATEWGWDRETFLSQTCIKAGLPPEAWKKEGTKIEVFSAEVFSEQSMGIR